MQKLKRLLLKNPLIETTVHLRGNERACLWTEPLWGIPYNLYVPFASVYMAALGLSAVEIGTVSTVFFASQMVWALLSGPLTDKLGRRLCTVIFDVLSWSVPALMWMCAQNYWWFFVAALFNGMWRVTENSWGLLLIEEAPEDKLVHMYSISHVAGLVAGFIAPLAYVFVQKYSVVPTMRVLYGITFVMMTAKFLILYFWSHETAIGKRRREEFRNRSIWAHLLDSRHVLMVMLRDRKVMLTIALLACFATIKNVNDSFWALLVQDKLGIAAENLSIFSTIRSLLMLLFYFVVVPKVSLTRFKQPMLLSFLIYLAVQLMMVFMPVGQYWLVVVAVAGEALALSVLNPVTSSLQVVNVDTEERARMLGLFYAMTMLVTSPSGIVAGYLSDVDRALPFVLTAVLCVVAVGLSMAIWRLQVRDNARQSAGA